MIIAELEQLGPSLDAGLSPEEAAIGKELENLAQGDLLGDAPRVADCSVWANLMHTAYTLAPNPPREAVRASRVLTAYIQRLADRAELQLPPLQ